MSSENEISPCPFTLVRHQESALQTSTNPDRRIASTLERLSVCSPGPDTAATPSRNTRSGADLDLRRPIGRDRHRDLDQSEDLNRGQRTRGYRPREPDHHSSEEELTALTSFDEFCLGQMTRCAEDSGAVQRCPPEKDSSPSSDEEVCHLLACPPRPVLFSSSPPKGVHKRCRIIAPRQFFSRFGYGSARGCQPSFLQHPGCRSRLHSRTVLTTAP